MRNIRFFVIAATVMMLSVGGWIATTTHANSVKVEDAFRHRSTPTAGSALPLVF
jgi:hypothetical protein